MKEICRNCWDLGTKDCPHNGEIKKKSRRERFNKFKEDLWWDLKFKADLASTCRFMRSICNFLMGRIKA